MYTFVRGVSMLRTNDLVDLCVKRIPDKYRIDVWMIYSGALDLQVIYSIWYNSSNTCKNYSINCCREN